MKVVENVAHLSWYLCGVYCGRRSTLMFMTAEVGERRRPRLKYVLLGGLAGLYLLVVALVTVLEGKLVFPAPVYFTQATPADAGMAFEDIHIPVDGKTKV